MINIKSNDFSNAWASAVRQLMASTRTIPANNNRAVMTKDDCVIFELGADAIQGMLDCELHPMAVQTYGLDTYISQFIDGTAAAIRSKGEQPYTYMGRTLSQLKRIREEGLLDEPFNRRIQVVTWDKFEDLGSSDPPCWQTANLRNMGNGEVEISMFYRSHDIYGAWQFNNIALMKYLNREVLEPAGLTPSRFVEMNVSGHVYDYNFQDALKVYEIPVALTRRYE
jgi:thymidylate synthase